MENEINSLFSMMFQLLSALTQEVAVLSERVTQHDSSLEVKSARERIGRAQEMLDAIRQRLQLL